MSFDTTVLLASGIYMLTVPTMITTQNIKSALIFKSIPLLLGVGCLLAGFKGMGWV